MRKKVISILFIAIILISTLLSYKTYAIEWQEDYNVKLNYKIEENNGKKQVVIPVTIENVNLKGGILACSATIEYDDNVFENIEIKGTEKWEKIYGKNNKFMATKNTEYSAELIENPFIVCLTIKDGAKSGKTEVKIKNLSVGNILKQEKSDRDYKITVKITNNDVLLITIICSSVILVIIALILVYIFIIKPKIEKKKANEELSGLKMDK